VVIKHQDIKKLRVTSTSPINFIKISSSKVKVTKRMSEHSRGGGWGVWVVDPHRYFEYEERILRY